jgi:hypothetical protein
VVLSCVAHLLVDCDELSNPLEQSIRKNPLRRVETLQWVLFHDGRSVHSRMGSVLLTVSPSVKPSRHVIPIQAQVTLFACPWRTFNILPVHVPTLLVDPVLSCPEIVQLLLDFKLFASIGYLVIGILIDVEDTCWQCAVLLLGDIRTPGVSIVIVLVVVRLRLPSLFVAAADLGDVPLVEHLEDMGLPATIRIHVIRAAGLRLAERHVTRKVTVVGFVVGLHGCVCVTVHWLRCACACCPR